MRLAIIGAILVFFGQTLEHMGYDFPGFLILAIGFIFLYKGSREMFGKKCKK